MFPLLRALVLWACLAASAFVLTRPEESMWSLLSYLLPTFSVVFTLWSLYRPAKSTWARVGWWTLTLAGWLVVALLAQGPWGKAIGNFASYQPLVVGWALALGLGVWMIAEMGRLPLWRSLAEAGTGAAVLALTLAGVSWRYEARTQEIAAQAEARWAQIGRPMTEFEKTITPKAENEALAELGRILRAEVDASLYKGMDSSLAREQPAVVKEAVAVIGRTLPLADKIVPEGPATPTLDNHAAQLDAAYARILAAPAPVWAMDPREGLEIRMPSFLSVRIFSQVITADATRRMERGDATGAARAIAAGLHFSSGLREHPTLVCVMIRVAVESLFTRQQVRLPAEPGALEALAEEAARLRLEFQRAFQFEAWSMAHSAAKAEIVDAAGWGYEPLGRLLPPWARRWVCGPQIRRECFLASLAEAEQVAILSDPAILSQGDLGSEALDRAAVASGSIYVPNFLRANIRLNATLVLREQTELLRLARTQLAAGRPLEARASVVLPGRRWEFTADPVAHTVSLRLDRVPQWIASKQVIPDDFWLLPLDGSKAWQFAEPGKTAER